MRLLIVEDDKDAAGYMEKGLRESGHAVDLAHTGREGLLMAAGGIGSAADVAAVAAAGADCAVIGRALYDGSLTLLEASASARSSPTDRPS